MDRAGGERSDADNTAAGTAAAPIGNTVDIAGPPPTPTVSSSEGNAAPTAHPDAKPVDRSALEAEAIDALCTVFDPEIPVNIYELGLIYDLDVSPDGRVRIAMTLTSPACPVAGSLPGEVEAKVREIDGVTDVEVELVWDPPWTPDRMSEAARLELGFM